jgi:hypothetical protein
MKLLIAYGLILAGFVTSMAHAAADPRHYQIKRVLIRELPDQEKIKWMNEKVGNFTEGCSPETVPNVTNPPVVPGQAPSNPLDMLDVIVDKIINIGKKIWAIVDAGRPVVNIKVDTANALPAGIACWDQLEGWKAPTSKLYQVAYENGFGVEVVTFNFRVSFISGGSYKGQGQYLTLASVQPALVDVSWGFRFDAVATVPMVFNQGTKVNPVAGMQLAMNWKVSTPIQETQQAENFFINGTGDFRKLK